MITKSNNHRRGVFAIDKAKYLMELKGLLSFMDADEKAATVAAYKRLFEQAGPAREQALIEELGSPVRLVLKLEKDYRNGKLNEVLAETAFRFADESKDTEGENYDSENVAQEEGEGESPFEAEETPAVGSDRPSLEEEAPVEEAISEPAPGQGENAEEPIGGEAEKRPTEEKTPEKARKKTGAKKEKKENKKDKKEKDNSDSEAPAKGSTALAVILTPFLIVLAALVLTLVLLCAAVPGSVGALFSLVGGYFAKYALFSMSYVPDILMVLGLAVVLFGLTFGLLGIVLRLLFAGFKLDFDLLSSVYGKLLGKEKAQDE